MESGRKFSRLPFNTESGLSFHGEEGTHSTHLIDISLKGALVDLPAGRPVSIMERVRLQVRLPGSDVTITMDGEVAHVEQGHLGMNCVSIDMESMIHLRSLMELNLGDPGLLERELFDLGK